MPGTLEGGNSTPKSPLATIIPSDNSIILIDDGKVRLKVLSKKKDALKTKVLVGGNLSSNKGLNLPNLILDTTPITKKDRDDLTFILENEIDWIALSFVQKVDDVKYVQKIIKNKKTYFCWCKCF